MNVEEALEAIGRWQPVTNAFSQIYEDAKAEGSGPLAGVPVAVKDLFDVAGRETSGCSEAYRGTIASGDARVVRRLRDAGAVVVGKTNMHELAFGTTNLISACGPVRNPWDPARIPGGSSGGSGAAVASRCVPIALGTDTGGSIRIPAAFCGVFGLKPTHGALSLEGVMPLAVSLDCPGPLAATATDLTAAWEVLSGETAPAERAASIGVLDTQRATGDVLEALAATAAALEGLGARTQPVPDRIADAPEVWVDIAAPEFPRDHPALADRLDRVHPIIAAFYEYGRSQPPERREHAQQGVDQLRSWFDEQLEQHEAILMPATPYAAPRADDEEIEVASGERVNVHVGGPSNFTRPVNLVGLPAVVVPAGMGGEGVPIGVQLVGRRAGEATLLATARALEDHDPRFRAGTPASPA